MKLIIFGVCVLLWGSQLSSAAFPPVIITSCVKEHKVKGVELAIFYGTDMAEATQPVKCYLTCLFESSGFIVNGEVNQDIMAMVEGNTNTDPRAAVFFEMIKFCKDTKSTIECESGFLYMKCFADYGKGILNPQESTTEL